MDALIIACSWNANVVSVWACMLWSLCSWNTGIIIIWAWTLWSSHASEHESYYALGMDALLIVCSGHRMLLKSLGTRTLSSFAHGCSVHRMLLEHERYVMVWAWMLWSSYALGTRTSLWFGHRLGHNNRT